VQGQSRLHNAMRRQEQGMKTSTVVAICILLLMGMLMVVAQTSGEDASPVGSLKAINEAQANYVKNNPAIGYACDLAALAQGKEHGGYHFKLECKQKTKPVSEYRVSAVPSKKDAGQVYCTDQSGIVRSSNDGETKSCWTGPMVK
jgi:hypothetical protein